MSLPVQKCTIVNLDDPAMRVTACYNPNKINITKAVPWNRHKAAHGNAEMLEFTSAKNKTLSVELFFDCYEARLDVYDQYIEPLLKLTDAYVAHASGRNSKPADQRRPPFVMLVWGEHPPFKGVIESVDIEYSMFLPNGRPVRATCTLKVTELAPVQVASYRNKVSELLEANQANMSWAEYAARYRHGA